MVYSHQGHLFDLEQDPIVSFYTVDLNTIGVNLLLRFVNELDVGNITVKWQGIEYSPIPIYGTGFEIVSGRERQPSPTVKIGNINAIITTLTMAYQDLRGAKVTRVRTLARHLDGGSNPDASRYFPPDVFFIERKVAENNIEVVFELKTALEYGLAAKIPRRQMFHNQCEWRYRSSECGYFGGPVADINDNPTSDPARDECGKRIQSCKYRFGEHGILNWGGFPGLDSYRL